MTFQGFRSQGMGGGDPEFDRRGRGSYVQAAAVPVVFTQQTQLDLSEGGCSDPPSNLPAAVDLLERQACNCDLLKAGLCLRCELLEMLR